MADCPERVSCPMAERIVKLEDWKTQSEAFHKKTEKFQETSTESSIRMEGKLDNVTNNVNKLVEWHDSEQAKPQKRFDMLADNVWLLVVAAFVGYILGHIGLG